MAISSEKIRSYKIEIVLLIVIIVAILIAIDIDNTLINIGREGRDPTPEEQRQIKRRAELVSIIYLVASLYFVFVAFRDYQENRTKANYYFFVATILLAVAAGLREYWISKDINFEGGAEDYAL